MSDCERDVLLTFILIHKLKIVLFSEIKINVCVCVCPYCHMISVIIAEAWIDNWIYLTPTERNYK
jgi:hypothetical protein